MRKYSAVFFDAGQTLIFPDPPMEEMVARVGRRHGLLVSVQDVKRCLPAGQLLYYERTRRDQNIWCSDSAIRDLWSDFYARLFEELGAGEDRAALGDEVYDEFTQSRYWRPFWDVEAVLTGIRRAGMVMGVISDWGLMLQTIFLDLGLARFFDFMMVSAAVRAAKNDSHIFALAVDRAGVRPEQALHVGDMYHNDVLSARAAGVASILLDREGKLDPQQLDCPLVRSLDEVLSYL